MNVLQMSIYGSAMILAILLIRAAGRSRLPRQTFVVLWNLAALRLLLPWAVPSALSVYALFVPALNAARPAAYSGPAVVSAPDGTAAGAALQAAEPAVSAPDPWFLAWLIGALATAVVLAALYIRWQRLFAASLPLITGTVQSWLAAHPLRRPLAVRQSDCISAPLTYGILRPVILLPPSAQQLDAASLDYILTHEYIHIRRFDALTKLILMTAVSVHWFNPLVWVMYILANRDMEISCDEAVVQRCRDRAGYARTLIQLEEQQSMLMPFCSSCSRNVLEERIRSIMKFKKYTVPIVVLAAVLIVCVGTALATSPPAPPEGVTQMIVEDVYCRMEPDGTTSYSFDGGRTFTVLTDEELAETYGMPEVEWWTAEEYEAWMEAEKEELQSLLGTKAWTSSDGEFTWTQAKIDETIALFEETLRQIRSGVRISKTVDGSDDIILAQDSQNFDSLSESSAGMLEEYSRFGLATDDTGHLQYEGQPVGYFEDRVEIGPGMSASRYSYYVPEGTVHVRTIRQATQNADGSTDPFGKLLGLERIPDAEAEQLIQDYLVTEPAQTVAVADETEARMLEKAVAADRETVAEQLKPYEALGLSWSLEAPQGLRMYWRGKAVHCLFDEVTGTWFANNLYGTDLPGSAAVHLEAVYNNGKLTGLRECPPEEPQITTAFAAESQDVQQGTTFEEMFSLYEPFGLTFETIRRDGAVRYNLFWNGRPVNHFIDVGGARTFTFDSTDQAADGITVSVVYEGGHAAGITQR